MSHSEFLVALENIIIDKVATVPTTRNRNIDTSASMEIGTAAKDDGESVREGGDLYKARTMKFSQGGELERKKDTKVVTVAKMAERTHGRRAETRACWTCGRTGHIAAWCRQGGNNKVVLH